MRNLKQIRELLEMGKYGFDKYCDEIYPELKKAYKQTIKQIDELLPEPIEQHLDLLSTHYARIREINSTIQSIYYQARQRELPQKERLDGNKITEKEREVILRKRIKEEILVKEKIEGLLESMEIRISVLQSRLKTARELAPKE